jgi:hypothetical protein
METVWNPPVSRWKPAGKVSNMKTWPNFFIVGALKAGTTSLYFYLKRVPGIYMSPVKEPHFFAVETWPANSRPKPIRDEKKYLRLFAKARDEKIIGEASVSYLTDPGVPQRIQKVVPGAKILISLRDPVEKAFSHYLMLVRNGRLKITFEEALQKALRGEGQIGRPHLNLQLGFYCESVNRYLNTFGSNQVKVLIFEEFIKDPKATVSDILAFLGLNDAQYEFETEAHNPFATARGAIARRILGSIYIKNTAAKVFPPSFRKYFKEKFLIKASAKPEMSQESRDLLVAYYHDDVKACQHLLGRQLPWPNFQF